MSVKTNDRLMERTVGVSAKAPLKAIAAALKREREAAGLSLTEVARQAGIAKSTLSQLEAGTGNPNLETLWALAVALDVSLADLLDPPRPQVLLVRAGEGEPIRAEHSDYAVTLLSNAAPGTRRDLYRLAFEPGPARESDPHPTAVIEHLVLSTGRALIGPADSAVELGPGDYISYPGDVPHTFQALEPGTTAVLVLEHR
jgi:transcriptional regulator with XRE-family HTH domain